MSFPTSHPACTAANQAARPNGGVSARPVQPRPLPIEGEHQLEKLQFALAIALTRGDAQRSSQLREEIARLGENHEEPGT